MTGGSLAVLAVILCTLNEFLAERFFGSFELFKGYPMILISAGIGVGLCFAFGVDILELVGFEGSYAPWVGRLFSGLIIGSGSNALHKFIKPASKR